MPAEATGVPEIQNTHGAKVLQGRNATALIRDAESAG